MFSSCLSKEVRDPISATKQISCSVLLQKALMVQPPKEFSPTSEEGGRVWKGILPPSHSCPGVTGAPSPGSWLSDFKKSPFLL